jgi:hypothetical protein
MTTPHNGTEQHMTYEYRPRYEPAPPPPRSQYYSQDPYEPYDDDYSRVPRRPSGGMRNPSLYEHFADDEKQYIMDMFKKIMTKEDSDIRFKGIDTMLYMIGGCLVFLIIMMIVLLSVVMSRH